MSFLLYYFYVSLKSSLLFFKGFRKVFYEVDTSATKGVIFSPNFGGKFDADKVETQTKYKVNVVPPKSIISNLNVTLHFEIEKVSMKDLSTGTDLFSVSERIFSGRNGEIDEDIKYMTKNFTPPGATDIWGNVRDESWILLTRSVTMHDVKKQNLDLMPGFRLTWYYSGIEVQPPPEYENEQFKKAFFRNDSIYKY